MQDKSCLSALVLADISNATLSRLRQQQPCMLAYMLRIACLPDRSLCLHVRVCEIWVA